MLARRSTLIALATLVVTLASVFSPTPPAAEAATTTRIAGSDRYETSALVAARIAPASGSTIFIANGLDFADALAAGPVAAAEGGVLLLSRVSEIPPSIRAQIIAIAPSEIVIVGGEGAFFARLRGPGKVWVQSLPFSRLAGRMLAAAGSRGGQNRGEGSVLGGLGDLISGN